MAVWGIMLMTLGIAFVGMSAAIGHSTGPPHPAYFRLDKLGNTEKPPSVDASNFFIGVGCVLHCRSPAVSSSLFFFFYYYYFKKDIKAESSSALRFPGQVRHVQRHCKRCVYGASEASEQRGCWPGVPLLIWNGFRNGDFNSHHDLIPVQASRLSTQGPVLFFLPSHKLSQQQLFARVLFMAGQAAFVPGMVTGILWSAGNWCGIIAISKLGMAIGWPIVQCNLLISVLWGLFYYKEVASYM